MSEPIPFTDVGVLKRHPDNPLLTRADAPYPCSLLFNAGIEKFHGRYVMVFRNDYGPSIDRVSFSKLSEQKMPGFVGTNLGLAFSDDGIPFANCKIGPGAPPIRTAKGWLTTFHGVWRDNERGRNGWEDSGEVKLYYGAADTVECLATAHVDDLLALVGAS